MVMKLPNPFVLYFVTIMRACQAYGLSINTLFWVEFPLTQLTHQFLHIALVGRNFHLLLNAGSCIIIISKEVI